MLQDHEPISAPEPVREVVGEGAVEGPDEVVSPGVLRREGGEARQLLV